MVQNYTIQSFPSGTWYYYGRFGTRFFRIAFQDATLQQLKNSGGLRYFKNHDVVDAIARYDQASRNLQIQLEFQNPIYSEIVKHRNELFNAYYLDEVMDINISQEKIDSFKRTTIPLLSDNKEDFIQYANYCQLRSNNNKQLVISKIETLEKAAILLATLKNEYHLK